MKNKRAVIILVVAIIFIAIATIFMFGGNLFNNTKSSVIRSGDVTKMPEATGTTEGINDGAVIEQTFVNSVDKVSSVGIVFFRITYYENVDLIIELLEGKNVIASRSIDASNIEIEHRTFVGPDEPLTGMKDKELTIKIYSEDGSDTGIVVMVSDKVDSTYKFNKKTIKGSLCFSVNE